MENPLKALRCQFEKHGTNNTNLFHFTPIYGNNLIATVMKINQNQVQLNLEDISQNGDVYSKLIRDALCN